MRLGCSERTLMRQQKGQREGLRELLLRRLLGQFVLLGLMGLCVSFSAQAAEKRCLYISSYHPGYEWSDGIERGMRATLQGQCVVQSFYLDSKRHTDAAWAKKKAVEALAVIDSFKPDVLLVSDDNASKYLVMPYLRDVSLPVVFSGLNWSVSEYGYPYRNATGMVEVAPVLPLLKQVRHILPAAHHGLFLSADVATERKDSNYYKKLFARNGMQLTVRLVKTFEAWRKAYREGQEYDFILLNNNAGITGWDKEEARQFVLKQGRILSVSNYAWMMPYVAFAITKVPEEQGEWMGQVAVSVLGGLSPENIPIVPNRRWEAWINNAVVMQHAINLPHSLRMKAQDYSLKTQGYP